MSPENKVLLPNSLENSRIYLADFDRVNYSQIAWTSEEVDQLVLNYQRKVKLLLLVKGHVLIPLTHLLDSELAREVLGPFPALFSSGAVIPMLPKEAESAQGFLQYKIVSSRDSEAELYRGSEPAEMAALIDESARFIRWEDGEGSRWFCQRLLTDMQDSQSMLRLAFEHNNLKLPKNVIRRLAKNSCFDRTEVYLAAKSLGDLKRWELISSYADFLFYLSGALSVKSEGILPQENLLDFSLGDLAGGKTHLSEYEVFTKLFIDIIKATTSTHFPADFLDALSIPDAIELHKVAMKNEFIEKYNQIQQTTKDSLTIHDPERLVLTLSELETYERDLHLKFESALKRELPSQIRERRVSSVAKIFHTIATLVIPYYGNIDAAKDILISGLDVIGREDVTRRVKNRVAVGVDAAERFVDRRDSSVRPILLDFVIKMKQQYSKYL